MPIDQLLTKVKPFASAGLDYVEERSIDELISTGDALMLVEANICVAFCPYQISVTSQILSNGNISIFHDKTSHINSPVSSTRIRIFWPVWNIAFSLFAF